MLPRLLFLLSLLTFNLPTCNPQTLHSGLDSNLRGISASRANHSLILWATGSNGTILRSPDAGKSWTRIHIDNADTADFRGIRSFGANIAYAFSVGNDNKSHIYKTSDAGKSWSTQYSDSRPAFFLDALACRSETDCFAISDPIDGKFPILHTEDGEHWSELPQASEPSALPTEGLFAASNSSLILCGPNQNDILFATGGPAARVFRSTDNAHTWTVASTLILRGTASAGIFSIACSGRTVVAVGGDYVNPSVPQTSIAYSDDLGVTWRLPKKSTEAYRSAVTPVATARLVAAPEPIVTAGRIPRASQTWIAIGPTGADISTDNALHWTPLNRENANAALAIAPNLVLTAGPKATITQLTLPSN